MKSAVIILGVLLTSSACGPFSHSTSNQSELMVDLGVEGNARARREVEAFELALDAAFVFRESGRKAVLLSGFNPFGGAVSVAGTRNVSGDLISLMEGIDRDAGRTVEIRLAGGARIARTTMAGMPPDFDEVDVWYFRGNTTWVTPAVIQIAVARISPNRVINFGQGSSNIIETGAINSTMVGAQSYDANGEPIEEFRSQNSLVNEAPDAASVTQLSWNPEELAGPTGYRVAPDARAENNYICNATAKILADALQGRDIQYLEGVRLPRIASPPGFIKHTFVHLAPGQELSQLDPIVRRVIAESF
jgi:hypothetical protein